MAEQNVTQRLTMISVAKTEGVEQAATAVGKLDRAVDQAGKSAAQAERVFDRSLDQVGQSAQRAAGAVDRSALGVRNSLGAVADYMRRDVPTSANYMREQMEGLSASYVRDVQRMGQSIGQVSVNVETGAREIIRSSVQMADATAKAGAQTTRVHASQVQQVERLQKAYDPLYREQMKVVAAEQQILSAVSSGALPLDRANELLNLQAARYNKLSQAMGGANDNVRLTSHQMTNLGYQANDVATMLLMGASPFQIIASQAGQVVQALGDGPQGVSGSMRAIGSSIAGFARAVPGAVFAVAGISAAVGALYYLTKGPQARSAEESVESFETAVKSLEDAWKGAGTAAEEHYERARRAAGSNPAAAMLDVQADLRKLRSDYEAQIRGLNYSPIAGQRIAGPRFGGWSEERGRIREIYLDLLNGETTARDMADEMTRIALDPNVEMSTRSLAEGIRQALAPAKDLEARINGINEATAGLSGRGGRVTSNLNESSPFDLRDRFGGGVSQSFGRIDPQAMSQVRSELLGQRAEFEQYIDAATAAKNALANFDLSPLQRQIAETNAEYDRQVALLSNVEGNSIALLSVEEARAAALGLIRREASAQEEQRRDSMALDLQAVSASSDQSEGNNQ